MANFIENRLEKEVEYLGEQFEDIEDLSKSMRRDFTLDAFDDITIQELSEPSGEFLAFIDVRASSLIDYFVVYENSIEIHQDGRSSYWSISISPQEVIRAIQSTPKGRWLEVSRDPADIVSKTI